MTCPPRQPAAACPAPTRPALHFTPPEGWMNDPNGLVYFDGEYHLFYQYHPFERVWGPMHWGHAVSRDLVSWEHLPLALAPDEQGMCFSGSAIVDRDDTSGLFAGEPGLLAFYTVHRTSPDDAEDYVQEQCLAYSRDRGRSWQKHAGNPIVAGPGFKDFRDPKVVWHEPSRRWVMALACGQVIRFYLSDNLLDWRLASEFGAGQGHHTDGPWECPDLFELPVERSCQGPAPGEPATRWVLVVGVGAGEQDDFGSFTQYFIGHFDGERFHNDHPAETVLLMDEGRDFYAVQSWSDVPTEHGRRLAIAWMNNWLYANQIPEAGWRGAMSFPRELSLVATPEGVRLRQAFAGEWQALAGAPANVAVPEHVLTAGHHTLLAASARVGYGRMTLALAPGSRVVLDLQQGDHQALELASDAETLRVRHHRWGENGVEAFDRHFPHDQVVGRLDGHGVELEWLVDDGSLELLLDGGRLALTELSFAVPAARPLVLAVEAGECRVEEMAYYSLV
ncbi:glycoside hydrolase family 32 protein [Halomonas heilongjiangensis]|uniref:Glycosyl hydrolase family 32 n=1 Tax=Halomonas heilongjiangensis TaxID=1387883 RepID=A0A2N7TW17_9GAMM|nr:glycoside hydrolase family 32 protein [Halomonas heilongjiangensis]PMR72368.1 glycosyl hydrolase family 32 [Halomonas heilongjiangensis]PXX86896.1 glycosyl hydrolase family 32 [Halomonas heilongjiangensis]